MSARIHPSALIHPGARLAADVDVGPYSVIGEHVEVGEGSWIGSHVMLDGRVRIGRRNRIFHFSSIGAPPQDKKYNGEPTGVDIPERMVDFCLDVARRGWNEANGWKTDQPHLASISLAEGASA